MAAERVVPVKLTLSADQYKAEAAKAKKATEEIGEAQDQVGGKSKKASEEAEQAAQRQREAWNAVGTGLVAAGTGVAILGAAMLKTGIEYNTLQQTTRAALTTLLGSAEAAADQMDRLDEFARNSPFAKQTFIQAQQQMIGFGVAVEDVLPALDAIQNTVAAFGGGNEQIAAIAEIMSRIKSEGRLSGDALQRLGYYGVDAAKLIGDQMGLTAAEIRDMASRPGGIPAEQVWDPLVNGMQEKFGGAADNVKNTFAGALDRVKAAWRDLSSALAEPFVGSEGGGLLVDLLNTVADLARAFEALPDPVQGGVVTLIALAGAAAFLQGSLILLGPKIDEVKSRMAEMDKGAATSAAAWRGYAAVIGTGFLVLSSQIDESSGTGAAALKDFTNVAGLAAAGFAVGGPWGAAIGGGIGLLQAFSSETVNVKGDLKALTATLDEQSGAITQSTAEWVSNQIITTGASQVFKDAGLSIATVTDAVLGDVAAQREFFDTLNKGKGDTFQATVLFTELGGQVEEAAVAHRDSKEAMEGSTVASQDLGASVAQQTEEWLANADAQLAATNAAIGQIEAQLEANETIAEGNRIVRDATGGVDLNAESSRNAVGALTDLAGANLANIEAMEASGAQSAQLDAALAAQRESFIATAIQMGYTREEAVRLADQYGQIPTSKETVATLTKGPGFDAIYTDIINKLNAIPGGKTFTALLNFATGQAPTTRATGGAVFGPGGETSDSIPALLSNGEHVLTAREVRAMGGHDEVYRMRASLRGYAAGGAVEYVGTGRSYSGPIATPSTSTTYAPTASVTVVGRPTASDQQIGQSAAQELMFKLSASGGLGS